MISRIAFNISPSWHVSCIYSPTNARSNLLFHQRQLSSQLFKIYRPVMPPFNPLIADLSFATSSNITAGLNALIADRNILWSLFSFDWSNFKAWLSQPRKSLLIAQSLCQSLRWTRIANAIANRNSCYHNGLVDNFHYLHHHLSLARLRTNRRHSR